LVTRFHNAALLFWFVCHKNVLLSINSDKTDEAKLHAAVERASGLLASYNADSYNCREGTVASNLNHLFLIVRLKFI
jgi:uncharacterized membrane-anchored protein